MERHTVDGKEISITFEINREHPFLPPFPGLVITSIYNKKMQREHLSVPTFLFEFAVNNGSPQYSHIDLRTQFSDRTPTSVMIDGWALNHPHIRFQLEVKANQIAPNVITFGLKVSSVLDKPTFLRLIFPKLRGLTTGDPTRAVGMIPIEIGSVVHLLPMLLDHHPLESPDYEGTMGMPYLREAKRIGLPTSMNSMEIASICDESGGGIFFADLDNYLEEGNGPSPIQFTLSSRELAGFNVAFLQEGVFTKFSDLAIGVTHNGDWHSAVDFYVQHHRFRNRWQAPSSPAWFRDTAAVYTFTGGGAGGIYLELPQPQIEKKEEPLLSRIKSYDEIATTLWNEAQKLGTNVIYLWDYWREVTPLDPREKHELHPKEIAYFNKGDYLPRWPEEDFKSAIRKVQGKGGRVILYVEPFIINTDSDVARVWDQAWAKHDVGGRPKLQGEHWAGRFPNAPPLNLISGLDKGGRPEGGQPWNIYPYCYTMVPDLREWQDHLISIVKRLTHDYNADGIMLDSYGWQMNLPMATDAHGVVTERWPFRWNAGVLKLMDLVLAEMGPDKVLLVETPSGPAGRHCHGGFSADFNRILHRGGGLSNQTRIVGSPIRYGMPWIRYFSNGWNLNELNQIYAAGHGLALSGTHLPEETRYIANLVTVRTKFADTLIRGRQTYQPETGRSDVVAYYYTGGSDRIITVVNTSEHDFAGELQLRQQAFDSTWSDLAWLPDRYRLDKRPTFTTVNGRLIPITVPGHSLRVLRRIDKGGNIYFVQPVPPIGSQA
jgi:hypothetical protein